MIYTTSRKCKRKWYQISNCIITVQISIKQQFMVHVCIIQIHVPTRSFKTKWPSAPQRSLELLKPVELYQTLTGALTALHIQ